ncbi:hypothetical protein HJA82_28360 [Rhizobium bangladeshense]|nr:hypothetical protein [Rhizobium bangladeshense]MBX5236312.1 hypothetical protein [Rhizobium sp. NLR4a]MBX5260347.1 hypothetical protein [Rhizobium sp. NLR16b]MBX5266437.1 hypothetical protein [Rhizobium sp. NLR16a]MBX5315005.1 hypothetical protein [Rhizobium sp. NLR11b]
MTRLIPDSLKLPAVLALGLFLGAAATFYPVKWIGAREERQSQQVKAAKESLDRINTLEKNNATFRNLPAFERCRVFMRDSGLPADECGQR